MFTFEGKRHNTVADAARALKVSTKAVQSYIHRGIIPRPPVIRVGLKELQVFPKEYLDNAKQAIANHHRLRNRS